MSVAAVLDFAVAQILREGTGPGDLPAVRLPCCLPCCLPCWNGW